MRQTFRQEEAEQILKKAMARAAQDAEAASQEVSQEQLVAMAAELGVEPAVLEAAAQEWQDEQAEQQERRAFIVERHAGFWWHLGPYIGVNTILVLINVLTDMSHFWAIYLIFGWGIGLLSHAIRFLPTKGAGFEADFENWRKARQNASSWEQTPRMREMKTILGSFNYIEPIQAQKPGKPQQDNPKDAPVDTNDG